jgi:hypothetical protein
MVGVTGQRNQMDFRPLGCQALQTSYSNRPRHSQVLTVLARKVYCLTSAESAAVETSERE